MAIPWPARVRYVEVDGSALFAARGWRPGLRTGFHSAGHSLAPSFVALHRPDATVARRTRARCGGICHLDRMYKGHAAVESVHRLCRPRLGSDRQHDQFAGSPDAYREKASAGGRATDVTRKLPATDARPVSHCIRGNVVLFNSDHLSQIYTAPAHDIALILTIRQPAL